MHTDNLELLRKEASRLIDLESHLLSSIKSAPGLIPEENDSAQTFDPKTLEEGLEVLSGERHKLDSMDMVVAVVGTMKAGKSTTINAIVGNEILPNRNGPMTSIPTLIRHSKGQNTPVVRFDNNAPINALCQKLNDVVRSKPEHVAKLYDESADMAEVIDFIKSGEKVKPVYEGRQGVFEFLRIVNDLVRICRELEQDFPFSDYDEMHELPVIEVEFTSLSEKESGLGNLTLLDTPGPNEAGQKHLKLMLRDQLRKASAVVTVLNYTQLKSESDESLRNEINAIADIAKGRMYAFVNKFDQRSHNDPDEAGVKKVVSNLLAGSIPEDSIFAVSAQQAFLGEVVQKYIRENGKLPDPEEHPWVEGFARDCFGRRWQSKLDDADRVLDEAKGYWEDSGFALPLEKVVHAAHQNAAYYALDSTASKLASLAERISNFVNGRETALQKTTVELQGYIASLKSDVDRISELRGRKEEEADLLFGKLKEEIEATLADSINEARSITGRLFKDGVIESQKKELAVTKGTAGERADAGDRVTVSQKKRSSLGAMGLAAFMHGSDNVKDKDSTSNENKLDTSKREIEFRTKKEAKEFVNGFEKALKPAISNLNKKMSKSVDSAIVEFDKKLRLDVATEAEEILGDVSQRLGKEGFEINLRIPSNLKARSLGLGDFAMGDGISEDTKTVTRLKRQDSWTGDVKRFFGGIFDTDWGYDEYETDIDVYKVSLDKLNSQTQETIEENGKDWRYEVKEEVEMPVRSTLKEFFDELERKVEVVRGDLLQGIDDKEKSKNEQAELLNGLRAIAKNVPGMMEDTDELQGDARQNLQERLA